VYRAGYCSGNAQLDFLPGHRQSRLRLFVVFLSTSRQIPGYNCDWVTTVSYQTPSNSSVILPSDAIWSRSVVPIVGCTAPWGLWDYLGGRSERVVLLFTIEVTLDQTLGNWCHFIKPNHRIKNLLTVKQLLNVASCFIVIIFLAGLFKPLF
jgi:hypothetical protein